MVIGQATKTPKDGRAVPIQVPHRVSIKLE
jgi:hypothetical protein